MLELASDDCVDGFDDDENIYEPVSFDLISIALPIFVIVFLFSFKTDQHPRVVDERAVVAILFKNQH